MLVEGDPTRDILATRNIVSIWKRGLRVRRDPSLVFEALCVAPTSRSALRRICAEKMSAGGRRYNSFTVSDEFSKSNNHAYLRDQVVRGIRSLSVFTAGGFWRRFESVRKNQNRTREGARGEFLLTPRRLQNALNR